METGEEKQQVAAPHMGAKQEVTGPALKMMAREDLCADSLSTEPEESNRLRNSKRRKRRRESSTPQSSCPLKWWRENSSQYPLLSPLAKACFSVPATSVQSEGDFSTSGDTVGAQRPQLLPENVDVLTFLEKNFKKFQFKNIHLA